MKKILIVVVVLLLLAGGGYLYYQQSSANRPLKHVSIRLNWVHNAQFTGEYVAVEKGFYKQEGLDVDIREYQDNLDQGQELADDKVTYSVYTPIELLSDISKGRKLKAIAAIYQTSPFAFVSLASTNITSPLDFKGKVLGAKGGNNDAKLTYPTLARAYGVSPLSYTVKDLDFSMDEGDDITKKRADMVDLYRTDQVYFLRQRGIRFNLLYPEDFGFKSYGDTIVTTDQQIATDPEGVRAFVKATQEGWNYAIHNTQEALQIDKKYEDKLYNDPKHEEYILSQSLSLIQPSGDQPIGTMNVIIWNNVISAMKTAGVLQTNIEPSDAYTTQFLQDN